MKLLTKFELEYIYENSPVERKQDSIFKTIKTARPTSQFLYNYKYCTVREPKVEGIQIAVLSEPTAESIYHENKNSRLIEEKEASILLQSQAFPDKD
jgi:hypothetical protein